MTDSLRASTSSAFRLRRLPARLHGLLDYTAAAAMILLPPLLGLGREAAALSQAAGAFLVSYSLLADYGLGVADVVPIRVHLLLDLAAGMLLLAAPFLLGFEGLDRAWFVALGLGVFGAVAVTDPRTAAVAVHGSDV